MSRIHALLPQPGVLTAQQGEYQGRVLMDQLHKAGAIQRESVDRSGGVPRGANQNSPQGAGGGTVGTGSVPSAGESGFTGND